MELSPRLYHWIVRPKFFTNMFIHNVLKEHFDFTGKTVLDFGCGIGSCSKIFEPSHYLGLEIDHQRIKYAQHIYPDYRFELMNDKRLADLDHSIDNILIVAVLHHISSLELQRYLEKFKRILKPYGKILVIEPCLTSSTLISNKLMCLFDNGKYLRYEEEYLEPFRVNAFKTTVFKRYRRHFYNELFFSAELQ